MIVKKLWITRHEESIYFVTRKYQGWFLFGVIPLYVEMLSVGKEIN